MKFQKSIFMHKDQSIPLLPCWMCHKLILDFSSHQHPLPDKKSSTNFNQVSSHVAASREVLEEYIKNMKLLSESLLKAMATSLNVEENCFLDQCGDRQTMIARFKFYPPCPKHADASAITILLQDKEVEGLQVLKDDQWFRVPVVPYGFLVNVGDQVEIMSNDIFKSPMHRVVTNAEREGNTLAVFIMPDVDVEIGPVEAYQ